MFQKLILGLLLIVAKTSLMAGFLDPEDSFRFTVVLYQEKKIDHYFEDGTLHITIENTDYNEISETFANRAGKEETRTKLEPYDSLSYSFIKSCAISPNVNKKTVQVRYLLNPDRPVEYSVFTKENPFRLIIEFWDKRRKK